MVGRPGMKIAEAEPGADRAALVLRHPDRPALRSVGPKPWRPALDAHRRRIRGHHAAGDGGIIDGNDGGQVRLDRVAHKRRRFQGGAAWAAGLMPAGGGMVESGNAMSSVASKTRPWMRSTLELEELRVKVTSMRPERWPGRRAGIGSAKGCLPRSSGLHRHAKQRREFLPGQLGRSLVRAKILMDGRAGGALFLVNPGMAECPHDREKELLGMNANRRSEG